MKPIMYEGLPTNGDPSSVSRKITIFSEWLKAIAVLVFVFIGVCLGIVLIHVNTTLTKLDTTLDSVSTEVKAFDNTRKSLDDLMTMSTTLIIDADTAATDETAFFTVANTKLSLALDNVNGLVTQATADEHELSLHTVQTLDATTKTITGIQPVLDNVKIATGALNDNLLLVKPVLMNTNLSLATIQKVFGDPAIPKTITNVQETSANVASMTKDGADEVHNLVHPTKVKGFKATLGAVITYLAHLAPPFF